ncbi:hypothetical protein BGZ95_000567 [Linnemannia exigua]|uniref:Uncharacterized protein n=1 Tax=Linnemannia exigua TaxID=604196 RepID=A0AAD4D834_9FUNG|nr:hypothetical protein BGZ95_000567 [Linnemannia exigua]
MSKQGKTTLEVAIEALTTGLQNGEYFTRTTPKDFDAEGFFTGFQDQRKARSIWSSVVIPRLMSSNHGELRKIGLSLQKKWASKSYRKQLDKARAHVKAVLESVHKHQAKVLDHSYKDLCHTLEIQEASMSHTQGSSSHSENHEEEDSSKDQDVDTDITTKAQLKRPRDDHNQESDFGQTQGIRQSLAGQEPVDKDLDTVHSDTFSDEDKRAFTNTFLALKKKTGLPSGKTVEDILFTEGIVRKQHDLIHSFVIDVDDESTRALFKSNDWSFIVAEQDESVELSDCDVIATLERLQDVNSISSLMDILNQRHLRLGKDFRMERDYDLKWLYDAVSKWIDMYMIPFPVFNSDAPLEFFWRSQVWGVLDSLFFDLPDIFMIGGEGQGLESTNRRNTQQLSKSRKVGGSKSDGYLRSFGASKADIMTIEGGRNWDPFAKKYKSEAGWKIGRQLHDIFRARTVDQDAAWCKQLKTYGIIFGVTYG